MSSNFVFAVGLLLGGQVPQPWEFNPPLPPGARIIGPAHVVQPAAQPAPIQNPPSAAPAPPPPVSHAAPQGGSPIPDKCDGCATTPTPPPVHDCEPVVAPRPDPDPSCTKSECKPIKLTMNPGNIPRVPGNNYPACVSKKPATGTVKVPTEVCDTYQEIHIKRMTFQSACCKFEICVPYEECCTDKVRCDLRPRHSQLEICFKPNNKVDVYVLDVPGMPHGWVIYHDQTLDYVKSQIPDLQIQP